MYESKKNIGTVSIKFPIPPAAFEEHRLFHYKYGKRYSTNGRRIVTNTISFVVWLGDACELAHAESPIYRRINRRKK